MDNELVIKNGQLIPKEQANISVYNKALFFDFCVYSNIKVVNSKMYLPQLEIDKLFESAAAIGLPVEFTDDQLLDWAQNLVDANNLKDALIRILLVGPEKDNPALLFMFPVGLTFYPDKFYKQGVKLISFKGERYFPTAKTKNLLMSYLAYQQAVKQNALDALLVDNDGYVREGTRSSFFVIKENKLIMPPKDKVLPGLTKTILLKILPANLELLEQDIPWSNINKYDEYFITATSMKIMPVRQIDDSIVSEEVGPITKQLIKLFKEYQPK